MDLAIANVLLIELYCVLGYIEIILCGAVREKSLWHCKKSSAMYLADMNNWYFNNPSFLVKLPLLAP